MIHEKLLKTCEDKGATAAEIYCSSMRTLEVSFVNNEIRSINSTEDSGIGIRVLINNRVGFSYTNLSEGTDTDKKIEDAIKLAKVAPRTLEVDLAHPSSPFKEIEGLYDKSLAFMDVEDFTHRATEILASFVEIDKKLVLDHSIYSIVSGKFEIYNSYGIEGIQEGTGQVVVLTGLAKEGARIGSYAVETGASRSDSLDVNRLVQRLAEKALAGLDVTAREELNGAVIFSPTCVPDLIASSIEYSVDGDNVNRKRSLWADKMGEKVAAESLSAQDLPHEPYGFGSTPFDGEGTPTSEVSILKEGILSSFLHNIQSAKKARTKSTGNASRSGYFSPPIGISPNNFKIAGGDFGIDELVSDTGNGIVIHRFSGNLQSETGHFSGVAKQTFLVENGEISKPTKGVVLSGNVYDLLLNISGITKDREVVFGAYEVPWIRVDGLDIVKGSLPSM